MKSNTHGRIGMLMIASLFVLCAASPAWEVLKTEPLEAASKEDTILKYSAKSLNRQYEEKFPLAGTLSGAGWYSVDLKPYCNLNIFSGEGQTCPVSFPCMPLGRQVYYGVPFEIIAPAANSNKTTLALPSQRLLPASLPASVEVAVGKKAAVLYFLTATFYTSPEGDQYFQVNYADGAAHKIKFVGETHAGDWYHPYTRIYTEDVHYVLVPAARDAKTSFRNMHILQWKNPAPEKVVKTITFKGDPAVQMAILLVAVTGHE